MAGFVSGGSALTTRRGGISAVPRRGRGKFYATTATPVEMVPGLEVVSPEPFRGKTGIALMNIGSPESLEVKDVREYLRQFLGDGRVVDLNPIIRWLVLNLFILPSRPQESAEAYSSIWDEDRGSPLIYHTEDLAVKLRERLGEGFMVELGMQYCEPNISTAFEKFRSNGVDRIVILPMYPQYASSATGAAVEIAYKAAAKIYNTPYLHVVPAFFDHPAYLRAYAETIRETIGQGGTKVDHLLMSFHGTPEQHCFNTDETGLHCKGDSSCCKQIVQANRNCYRAQCYETARKLAVVLELTEDKYTVAFQSRLSAAGKEWIKPYTDAVIEELAEKGIKRLACCIPSFTTDCLETLEEIGIRGKEDFIAAGGDDLLLIPCLNSSDAFADGLLEIIRDSCPLDTII